MIQQLNKITEFAKANLKEHHILHFENHCKKVLDKNPDLTIERLFDIWKKETADKIYDAVCEEFSNRFRDEKYIQKLCESAGVEWIDAEKEFGAGCDYDGSAYNIAISVCEEFFN